MKKIISLTLAFIISAAILVLSVSADRSGDMILSSSAGMNATKIDTVPSDNADGQFTAEETRKRFPFTDVPADAAYYDAVSYLYHMGITIGTGATTFSPQKNLNRATVVTMLYRLDGEPSVGGSVVFDDVDPNEWYGAAVEWASENDIVNGFGDGKFLPLKEITNEQLAAIIRRYAEYKGVIIYEITTDMTEVYNDANVSEWAADSVYWAESEGIISSDQARDGMVYATRAEIAFSIYTFITKTGD